MEWISVKDRLPELEKAAISSDPFYSNDYLCFDGKIMFVAFRYRSGKNEYFRCSTGDEYDEVGEITHWMPLPNAPKD